MTISLFLQDTTYNTWVEDVSFHIRQGGGGIGLANHAKSHAQQEKTRFATVPVSKQRSSLVVYPVRSQSQSELRLVSEGDQF